MSRLAAETAYHLFRAIPKHDLRDEESIRILKNVRRIFSGIFHLEVVAEEADMREESQTDSTDARTPTASEAFPEPQRK